MDVLIATLSIIAGVLAVIAGALPLYVTYKERQGRKQPLEENYD